MPIVVPRIVPLDGPLLDGAAELLAARHARWRAAEPALPQRYADVAEARTLLAAVLASDGALGLAALCEGGQLIGVLAGAPRLEEIWGRSAWVPIEGEALIPGVGTEPLRDLYAAWGDYWVRRGIFAHYALVPSAFGETVDAWFSMGFGRMQVYAIRSMEAETLGPMPAGVAIRRAGPEDLDVILPLLDLISRAHQEAPTFAITLPERWSTFRAELANELATPEGDLWLAVDARSGLGLGLAGFYPAEPGPSAPDGAVELGVAMTAPEARGRGVMRALLRHGLEVAAASGATSCLTDWRSANLTSSRAWPALGFRPRYWRLHRMVDQRIGWAREATPPS